MKSFMAIVAGFLIVATCSFNADQNIARNTTESLPSDSLKHSVFFSIDNAKYPDGKITGLHFYYLDSIAHSQMPNISTRNAQILLGAPTLLIEANAQQIPFLVYPGEKINIKNAGSDSTQMYIQGNARRTNELDFFRILVHKTGNLYYSFNGMPYHRKVNTLAIVHNLEQSIHKVKENRLQLLKSYSGRFRFSDGFNNIATNCIKSTAVTDSLLLYYNNRQLLTNQNLYKSLITSKIVAIRNIGFMPFPMYYVACMNLVSLGLGNAPHDVISGTTSSFIKRFDFIENAFTGVTKDFLLANTLYSANLNRVSISKAYLDKFNTQCTDKGYSALTNRKLRDDNTSGKYLKGSNKLLASDGRTVQDLKEIISKHKGKLILLDFWASWCGPCRAEMPSAKLLKKDYENKKIVFVAISTDANINDWQKAAKEEGIGSSDSYLLLNADQASFTKHYKINSIPRYMLIGKSGTVINDDAPRPSDPKLRSLVNGNL